MKIGYNSESKLFSVIDPKEKTKEFGYLGWRDGELTFDVYFAGKKGDRWKSEKFLEVPESELDKLKEDLRKQYSELKYYKPVMDSRSVAKLEQMIEDFCDEQNGGGPDPNDYGYWR